MDWTWESIVDENCGSNERFYRYDDYLKCFSFYFGSFVYLSLVLSLVLKY